MNLIFNLAILKKPGFLKTPENLPSPPSIYGQHNKFLIFHVAGKAKIPNPPFKTNLFGPYVKLPSPLTLKQSPLKVLLI